MSLVHPTSHAPCPRATYQQSYVPQSVCGAWLAEPWPKAPNCSSTCERHFHLHVSCGVRDCRCVSVAPTAALFHLDAQGPATFTFVWISRGCPRQLSPSDCSSGCANRTRCPHLVRRAAHATQGSIASLYAKQRMLRGQLHADSCTPAAARQHLHADSCTPGATDTPGAAKMAMGTTPGSWPRLIVPAPNRRGVEAWCECLMGIKPPSLACRAPNPQCLRRTASAPDGICAGRHLCLMAATAAPVSIRVSLAACPRRRCGGAATVRHEDVHPRRLRRRPRLHLCPRPPQSRPMAAARPQRPPNHPAPTPSPRR
mmetsp:Transcript_28479/g.84332  ORF Transcript_28479/g.84332 Transcript_28479/m.84332 type:complete len:313 (-) Transcript_28479:388-1326(-)